MKWQPPCGVSLNKGGKLEWLSSVDSQKLEGMVEQRGITGLMKQRPQVETSQDQVVRWLHYKLRMYPSGL
jgi:hypothetical protein